MISLDKTPQSIAYSRIQAKIGNGLRRNNLLALAVKFDDQFARRDARKSN